MHHFLRFIAVCLFLGASAAAAASLAVPQGRALLTVSGAIGANNAEGAAVFDRDMLRALDWQEIETYTSFTEGLQRFAGPTLASLIAAVEAQGGTIEATAMNDYTVEFPITDAAEHGVILAMEHNGVPMRIRNKGPIWVVYPATPEEADLQKFDAEMIWQLDRIQIK